MTEPGAGAHRLTVLYDADCPVCTRIAGRLAGLDRAGRLRFVPLQLADRDRPEVRRLAGERDLSRSLHVVEPDGRWLHGGRAVLRAFDEVPLLRALARLGRLPFVAPLVETGYRLFARHRGRFAWLAGSFRAATAGGSGQGRRSRSTG